MTVTRFLTWNIQNNHTSIRQQVMTALVHEYAFDVVVLQEAHGLLIEVEMDALGYELAQIAGTNTTGTVRIFLKKNVFQQLTSARSPDKDKKLVLVELRRYTSKFSFNIAAVHLYSKASRGEREQLWRNHRLLSQLQEWEEHVSTTRRTIMVGDFNANPYEINMRDPFLLRGHENRTLIRQFQSIPPPASRWLRDALDFWYNPMWHLLSDYKPAYTAGAAPMREATGSFYWYNEGEVPFWNLYDGFMVRPALMDEVVHQAMEVLVRTGPTSFSSPITSFLKPFTIAQHDSPILGGLPDHLPVTFTLTSL